jgi:hypothetical protein
MKKNRSGILLIAEIVAVILFHTFKIRATEIDLPDNAIVKISKSPDNLSKATSVLKTKPEFFFLNMLK